MDHSRRLSSETDAPVFAVIEKVGPSRISWKGPDSRPTSDWTFATDYHNALELQVPRRAMSSYDSGSSSLPIMSHNPPRDLLRNDSAVDQGGLGDAGASKMLKEITKSILRESADQYRDESKNSG